MAPTVTLIKGSRQVAKAMAKKVRANGNNGVFKENVQGIGEVQAYRLKDVDPNLLYVDVIRRTKNSSVMDSFTLRDGSSRLKHVHGEATVPYGALTIKPRKGRFFGLGKERGSISLYQNVAENSKECSNVITAQGSFTNPRNPQMKSMSKNPWVNFGEIVIPSIENVKGAISEILNGSIAPLYRYFK